MSLEIIEYDRVNVSVSEILATIKQRTGLELEAFDSGSESVPECSMRFPDMETAQQIRLLYLNDSGTFFIDADNHFLCYSIASGTGDYAYVDYLYKALVFDSNGKLGNVCYNYRQSWDGAINATRLSCSYTENDSLKSKITILPLRAYAYNDLNGANNIKGFVKNCYINYERAFQKCLKFVDENNNEWVTLGGYLLYYNGKRS